MALRLGLASDAGCCAVQVKFRRETTVQQEGIVAEPEPKRSLDYLDANRSPSTKLPGLGSPKSGGHLGSGVPIGGTPGLAGSPLNRVPVSPAFQRDMQRASAVQQQHRAGQL